MSTEEPLVSVIVPTYNSEEHLETCLRSVSTQTYEELELIVVDNESADHTQAIAQRYADAVHNKGPERSSQRNFGAEVSNGEYLFFIDSDMELTENVVEECVEESTGCAGAIVPERSVGTTFWAKCKALEKACYVGDSDIEAARFLDADLFHEYGGYDEDIAGGGEDWDLPQRIEKDGYSFARTESMIIHHEGDLTLLGSMRSKFYYGKTIDKYLQKHPDDADRQFTLIRPAFRRHWRDLVRNPLHASGMLFMKFCEYAAGATGLLSARIKRRVSATRG